MSLYTLIFRISASFLAISSVKVLPSTFVWELVRLILEIRYASRYTDASSSRFSRSGSSAVLSPSCTSTLLFSLFLSCSIFLFKSARSCSASASFIVYPSRLVWCGITVVVQWWGCDTVVVWLNCLVEGFVS